MSERTRQLSEESPWSQCSAYRIDTRMFVRRLAKRLYQRLLAPTVRSLFFRELISKTGNFGSITWLGHAIMQNLLDLWIIQETIAELRPELLIECGTNRGDLPFSSHTCLI